MSDKFIESFSGRIPLSQASQDVASQVMLRALLHDIDGIVCKNALFRRRCRVTQTVKACISTNAAINKSLRRSQKGSNQDRRLPSRPIADYDGGRSSDSSYSQGRVRRPNHQQGLDVEDMDHYGKLSQRFKALKDARIPRPNRRGFSGHLKTLAQESISEGLSSEETIRKAQAQYDYSRKPGGNRATRRAAEFGHAVQPALESQSQSNAPERRTAGRRVFARNDQFRQPRAALNRNSALDENEGSHELSLPKDLQDDQDDLLLPRHRFTMGRRTPEGEKISDTPTPSGSNGKVPSRGYNQTISASDDRAPLNMPYTTPASEFLYGTSVVTAALISPRRKLYKLYIYDGDNRESHDHDMKIRRMAVERGVTVERLKGDWLRVMDKMSGGRPHNVSRFRPCNLARESLESEIRSQGYVLEASPLPKLPVIGFRPVEGAQGPFHVILDHQSREDEQVNGKDTLIKYEVGFPRYPFVLLLDGIVSTPSIDSN